MPPTCLSTACSIDSRKRREPDDDPHARLRRAPDVLTERMGMLIRQVPTSLFCVHAMNCGPDPKKTKRRLAGRDWDGIAAWANGLEF